MPRQRPLGRLRARLRARASSPAGAPATPPEEAPEEAAAAPEPAPEPEAAAESAAAPEQEAEVGPDPEPAGDDAAGDPAPEPDPVAEEPQADSEPAAEKLGDEPSPDAPERERDPYPSLAPLSLGDLGETRRESVARRLRALRERNARNQDQRVVDQAESERRRPLAGAGAAASGAAGSIRRRASDGWASVPTIARQRIAAAAILAAVVLVVLLVVLPGAPCEAPGGEDCAPADDAIELVPDDALAYAHADIDPDSQQYREAAAIAARLPLLSRVAVSGAVDELARVDFESQIRPWAGGELAVAVLPGRGRLGRVLIVESDDDDGAREFAEALLGPRPATDDVDGVEVTSGRRGAATAIVDGFLLLGDEPAVTAIVGGGDARGSLDDDEAASEALDQLSEDLLAYGYLSGAGARALLADPSLASLDTFVDSAASAGVAVGVRAEEGLLSVESRSVLDPERASSSPGFFSALPPFAPELPADVGSDALAYLGLGEPGTSVDELLTQAKADSPELVRAFARAEKDLRKASGVSITEDILPLLGEEAALSIEPLSAEEDVTAPGTIAASGVPYVSLIADGVDAASAARSLAALQQPVTKALSSRGSAPVGFETARIAGVDAQSLAVSPELNLTYAVYDDRLVIATNPLGVEQARAEGEGLESADGFEEVTGGLPEEVSLLVYLDLRGLVSLGEEIGLAADPAYATYAQDLRSLEAAALAVTDADGTIRTDLRIATGEPAAPELNSSPLGGE